jgi:hypothetical protein
MQVLVVATQPMVEFLAVAVVRVVMQIVLKQNQVALVQAVVVLMLALQAQAEVLGANLVELLPM